MCASPREPCNLSTHKSSGRRLIFAPLDRVQLAVRMVSVGTLKTLLAIWGRQPADAEGTRERGSLMRAIITILTVTTASAVGIPAAWSGGSVPITGAIIAGDATNSEPLYVAAPRPDYIAYADDATPLPGPNCYWTRVPVYDAERNVVGWRGRPLAVCPQPRASAQAGE